MDSSLKASVDEMKMDFNNRMAAFEAQLQKSGGTSSGTSSLATDFAAFRTFVTQALCLLQQQVESLAHTVDSMEMQRRRKILLVHGVAEMQDENTEQLVTDTVKQRLQIADFSINGIQRCHRMGRPSSTKKPRPILLKLRDISTRDTVWFNKTKLKGSGVTLSEFLTKARHEVFMAAREKFGVTNCWTRDGNVFVLCSGNRHRVSSHKELSLISPDTVKQTTAVKAAPVSKTRRAASSKK